MDTTFKGAARRLDDLDLPRLGARIGVGEDEIHAFLDVETSGHGFDAHGRPIIRIRGDALTERLRLAKDKCAHGRRQVFALSRIASS